ncbi:MAG: hypothetical protein A3G18_02695 [Rhodospirillales bacterium RIFCSPLOWO2_12_FULL_58_28]|nr:MAG: hypothetical protein A3H92_09965 [Rhodospirillales bacterium RIFCSPLOWO2_02_FULL_58_16]OHC79467.1 MAG: hypothetical protein A3G18_02695 [Rhodospirillales bacterium RIFCSPLOWO2_12_FULL_58_28]
MGSNLILGMFAALALIIVVLIIISGVRMHRKISHNSALLKAHYQAMEAQNKLTGNKEKAEVGQPVEAKTKKKDTSGAGRNFKPTI